MSEPLPCPNPLCGEMPQFTHIVGMTWEVECTCESDLFVVSTTGLSDAIDQWNADCAAEKEKGEK